MPEPISTTTPQPPLIPPAVSQFATSPTGLLLLACAGVLVLTQLLSPQQKGKLARAYFAGARERRKARQLAYAQIQKRKHNRVGAFLGLPKGWSVRVEGGERRINLPLDPGLTYLADCQRGVLAIGGAGSGKTASLINPLLQSFLLQRFPLLLYDFKYSQRTTPQDDFKGQTPAIAGFARRLDYQIKVFAPGFPETCVCNLLDFLQSPVDALMARQLAVVLNRNLKMVTKESKSDPFFTEAGDQLSQAILMLAKASRYQDILMCYALLSLPNLAKRVQAAKLNLYIKAAFNQFLSSADSPQTAASIIATAQALFNRFVTPEVLSAFCGKTNIPLDLKGAQLLVIGLDKERRDVVGPLVASVVHLLVTRNTAGTRKEPLILSLDEIYTLYLPSIVDWLAQERESGLVTILGVQIMAMLEAAYGKDLANAISANCGTKALFNLQADAERFSKFFGSEEIRYKQKSRSHGKSGASRSLADHQQTRPLIEPQQFNTFPVGKCVLVNPGLANQQEASLPWMGQITRLKKADFERAYQDSLLWEETQQALAEANGMKDFSEQELQLRLAEAKRILPLPEEMAEGVPDASAPAHSEGKGPGWSMMLEQVSEV